MSNDQETRPQSPESPEREQKEDILEAEAHGQEPPQSDEGLLSGRADDYDHSDEHEEERPKA